MNEIINGYIARDKNDRLYLYSNKPLKGSSRWCGNIIKELDKSTFENITFNDKNPTRVELKINIKLPSTGEQK